jgi:hypothetical protein
MGVDLKAMFFATRGLAQFTRDLIEFRRLDCTVDEGAFPFGEVNPRLLDRDGESGTASGHYFHQDLLVARCVFASAPERHLDVGSRLDGFVAHVASFRPIEVLDIRSLTSRIPNIRFHRVDIMHLDPALVGTTDSLSCLHALEHFGLGRYGDPLDPSGHVLGLAGLHALLRPRGVLYLSVPIGPQRLEFNAHRVFSVAYLFELVQRQFTIEAFSFVDDRGDLHENVPMTADQIADNYGCNYGCGILELRRV